MSTNELPLIIGLTGGIATGKSTVTQMLRELEVHVIDADVIARKVVEPGSPTLEKIADRFGPRVLGSHGELNRDLLGQLVFDDEEARQSLNQIIHPSIAQEMLNQAMQAASEGHRWVVYDAALLVENNLQNAFAFLVVVSVSPSTQLERLVARDGVDPDSARNRIAAQLPMETKVAYADWVIDNDGSLKDTRAQVNTLYETLIERFGVPNGA